MAKMKRERLLFYSLSIRGTHTHTHTHTHTRTYTHRTKRRERWSQDDDSSERGNQGKKQRFSFVINNHFDDTHWFGRCF